MYNWQHAEWPTFTYDAAAVQPLLGSYEMALSDHTRQLADLPTTERENIQLTTSIEEGVRSAAIEGERISREDVRSSLLSNLRFGPATPPVSDLRARGVAALLREATRDPGAPVTETMLRYLHELLFRGQSYPGRIGSYRDSSSAMKIVSGPAHRPEVHFIAPPSDRVPAMMAELIERMDTPLPPAIRAGLAHLHFESIHPFADGNGRIGRALLERILLEPFGGLPLISISHAIQLTRDAYYRALQRSQQSLDATPWLVYLLTACRSAVDINRELVDHTLLKITFFDRHGTRLNEAQRKALRLMWAAGPEGFTGGMSAKKYRHLTQVSPATATRDLGRLVEIGALERTGAGRGVRYRLRT